MQASLAPMSHIKQLTKQHMYKQWETNWTTYPQARMSKLFLHQPTPNSSKHIMQYGRKTIGRIAKAISGHNNFNYFRSLIDPENQDPACRFCKENKPETFDHIMLNCPTFTRARLLTIEDSDNITIDNILKFAYIPVINSIFLGELLDEDETEIPNEDQAYLPKVHINTNK